jgi:hypothetical protein
MADKDDDKKPDDAGAKKPAVSFETEGAFLHEVESRSKKLIVKEADKASKAARVELLASLGLDEDANPDEVKTALAGSKKAKSEIETATADLKKLQAKLTTAEKTIVELSGFKDRTLRMEALAPHAVKFRDPEDMQVHLGNRLVIADDGKVTGPDGIEIGKLVDSFLETKTHLRSEAFKSGPGTSKVPAKGAPGTAPATAETKTNGEKKGYQVGDLARAALALQNASGDTE